MSSADDETKAQEVEERRMEGGAVLGLRKNLGFKAVLCSTPLSQKSPLLGKLQSLSN